MFAASVAFGRDQVEQHVEQEEGEVAASLGPTAQFNNGSLRIELGCLAAVELFDGQAPPIRIQAQPVHEALCRADFLLGHATIGFRQGAGKGKQRRDERRIVALPLGHAEVKHVPDEGADQHAEEVAEDDQAHHGAHDLAYHAHAKTGPGCARW